MKIKLSVLIEAVEKQTGKKVSLQDKISLQEADTEKYSAESKTVHGTTYMCAYPDKRGIENKDDLNKWESKDKPNRELMFVKDKKEAINTLKSFR